jgi:hypothetical protein
MGVSKRFGVRAIAVVTITVVTVLALATAAGATRYVVFKVDHPANLKQVCEGAADGHYSEVTDPKDSGETTVTRTCQYADGSNLECVNNDCMYITPRKSLGSLRSDIREVGGRSIGEVSDHSKVWGQTGPAGVDTVGAMEAGGCSDLGGEFVSSPDRTVGQCRTPTATIVCVNVTSKNTCAGFADSAKNAKLARKKVSASLKASSATTTGSPTTTRGSTTTSGSTTTTGATTTTTTTTPQRR